MINEIVKRVVIDFLEATQLQTPLNDGDKEKLKIFLNRNKLYFHFLQTNLAKKILPGENFDPSFHLRITAAEKKLVEILTISGLEYIFLKDLSKFSANSQYLGTDLDILIKPTDLRRAIKILLKNNYVLKNKPPHEITFLDKVLNVEIDLHFQVAQHRYFAFPQNSIHQLTELVFQSQKNHLLALEHQLLTMVIRYWTNDLLKGVKPLIDILIFLQNYSNKLNWSYFVLLSKKFASRDAVLSVIFLSMMMGSINLPKKSAFGRAIFIAKLWHKGNQHTLLSPNKEFWDNSSPDTIREILRCHFLYLSLQGKNSNFRLIRPRIIIFYLQLYWKAYVG